MVDDPTYPGAIAAFAQAGARLVGVRSDDEGLDPGALAVAVAGRPALVYVQPAVQSPTGAMERASAGITTNPPPAQSTGEGCVEHPVRPKPDNRPATWS